MTFWRSTAALALAFALGACQRLAPADEAAAFATLQENAAAMEREDLEGMMATIHSESALFASSRALAQEIFERFDLKYTLSDLKVVDAKAGEVRISFAQKTERVRGDESFKDNRVTGMHVLRREDGKWKIFSTPSVRVEELKR